MAGANGLFDGNREPPDQPRNLLQLAGIARCDGIRKPRQAFVIAECTDIQWRYRRRRFDIFDLNGVRH